MFGRVLNTPLALHKKRSFPLRISSVNVTRSAENCGFFVQRGFHSNFKRYIIATSNQREAHDIMEISSISSCKMLKNGQIYFLNLTVRTW